MTMSKKYLFFFLWLIYSVLLVNDIQGDETYDVKHYDIDVNVTESNTYEIIEKIHVHFNEPSPSIYRNIQIDKDGDRIAYDSIRISNDKQLPLNYLGKDYRTFLELKIGDEDHLLSGDVIYTIAYTYIPNISKSSYESFDYSLIGDEWNVPIEDIHFVINMPSEFDQSMLDLYVANELFEKDKDIEYTIQNLTITGSSKRTLNNESLVVHLPLPENYYQMNIYNYITTNLHLLFLGMFAIGIFLAYLLFSDKQQLLGVLPVQLYPPKDFNSMELGYIYYGERLPLRLSYSLLIQWASEGLFEIEEVRDKTFKKYLNYRVIKEMPKTAKVYEQKLFRRVVGLAQNGCISSTVLNKYFINYIHEILPEFQAQFMNEHEILINKSQRILNYLKIALFLCFTFALILMAAPMILLARIELFFILLILVLIVYGFVYVGYSLTSMVKVIALSALPMSVMTFITFPSMIVSLKTLNVIDFSLYFLCIAMFIIDYFLLSRLRFYTPYGAQLATSIEAFRRSFSIMTKDRIDVHIKENPEYIYDIMAYSFVLNLSSRWKKYQRFIGIASNTLDQINSANTRRYYGRYHRNVMALSFSRMRTSRNYDNSYAISNNKTITD